VPNFFSKFSENYHQHFEVKFFSNF